MGATVAFYQAIPYIQSQQDFFQRYFCVTWAQYAETGLFALGMALLIQKAIGLSREYRSLEAPLLVNVAFSPTASAAERAVQIDQATRMIPMSLRRSTLVTRVRDACSYVISRDTSEGLEEHLHYLAHISANSLRAGYALVRTITWTVPLLGLLGTVVGITTAIASIASDQVGSLTGEAAAGLASVFDTTTLALALSTILVLFTVIVEKLEGNVLGDVEQFGITELAPCFPVEGAIVSHPLANAEARAAEQLLQRTESLVTWQTELWLSALESMRGRWVEAADQQQQQFTMSLQQGMSVTLENHQQRLSETRNELLGGCRLVTQEMARVVDGAQQAASQQHQQFVALVNKVWSQMQEELARSQSAQAEHTTQHANRFIEAIRTWHEDLSRVSEIATAQMGELRRQGELLGSLTANEAELIRVQTTLQNNLQSLRAVEAFEESIHSLNAAVHLLTARALPHAA